MQELPLTANPFALMMDPDAVLQAVQRSDRLERLQRRVCRPLDKPQIACPIEGAAAFDCAIDEEAASLAPGD